MYFLTTTCEGFNFYKRIQFLSPHLIIWSHKKKCVGVIFTLILNLKSWKDSNPPVENIIICYDSSKEDFDLRYLLALLGQQLWLCLMDLRPLKYLLGKF